ncbi:glutamine-hydrolyzing carbamoyl-phosphate synthase small subunit [Marinivivus vitaminiproducens]|uniref:glutamine-hydrolyzing carbamoyl-phosphate synthase small subunit n=1 Tax=Marinivivus vitaminiproducens TaxID=3035935 RepID=UPI0027A384E7|nr:glutamine-hydrolyzing carbamoyl-phosphate synthase small subunit [Geminicoccaceae bacterium SCSIO 64248]
MISLSRSGANAALALADGTVFRGIGIGATGTATGEVVFNTAMTGYQEILSDPSYAGQIVTFTFPHIGNVGTNPDDLEASTPFARGVVLRASVTEPSNYRSAARLQAWLERQGLVGITGIDTRALTVRLRETGSQNAAIAFAPDGALDIEQLIHDARSWPGLVGMDLAGEVSARQRYDWSESKWQFETGYGRSAGTGPHIVALDYGIKRNILRSLASFDCRLTVLPAKATAADVVALRPDGVFLSNGPGDPEATGAYAVPELRRLVDTGLPVFGICLGHQMLALALGAKTGKMKFGHHGANHPVKDLETGKVEITSQNHGFSVLPDSLPDGVVPTHVSLFDGSLEGLRVEGKPVFSVQYHPEASPGPTDSAYLFDRFLDLVKAGR